MIDIKILGKFCLFAQLFFTQLVQCVKFLGQHNVLLKTATGQLHADNNCTIWNHHRNCSKVDL